MKAFVLVSILALAIARCVHPGEAPRTLVGLWGGQGIGMDIEGGVGAVLEAGTDGVISAQAVYHVLDSRPLGERVVLGSAETGGGAAGLSDRQRRRREDKRT